MKTAFLAPRLNPLTDAVALIAPAFAPRIDRVSQLSFIKDVLGFKQVFEYLDWEENQFLPFANSIDNSSAYLQKALQNPEVKAIFLCRGGFGTALLDIEKAAKQSSPKWIIGFSDLTAIFPLLAQKHSVIHGPVIEQFLKNPLMLKEQHLLKEILFKHAFSIQGVSKNFIPGSAKAFLRGGNLTVLSHNFGTKAEIPLENTLLFLEDVNEPLYKIHRMLNHLERMLASKTSFMPLQALLIGELSSDAPNTYPYSIKALFEQTVLKNNTSIPAIFDFPISHRAQNLPLPYEAFVQLEVQSSGAYELKLANFQEA